MYLCERHTWVYTGKILQWSLGYSFIKDSADKDIQSKTNRSVFSIPWITSEMRRKIRRKNKTHAKSKKTGSSKLRSKFETLRREIKADVREQHDLYVINLVGDVKANPRDFYRYINSQKKDTQGIPPLKRKNGKGVVQSDLEKAEDFNGQFTDVLNKDEHTQVPLLDRSAPFMNDIVISKDGIIKLLKGLNPSKALEPDELHMFIFSSNQWTLVKSQRNGLLQISAPFSRRVTGHLRAIIAQFPWLVYLKSYSNT